MTDAKLILPQKDRKFSNPDPVNIDPSKMMLDMVPPHAKQTAEKLELS